MVIFKIKNYQILLINSLFICIKIFNGKTCMKFKINLKSSKSNEKLNNKKEKNKKKNNKE